MWFGSNNHFQSKNMVCLIEKKLRLFVNIHQFFCLSIYIYWLIYSLIDYQTHPNPPNYKTFTRLIRYPWKITNFFSTKPRKSLLFSFLLQSLYFVKRNRKKRHFLGWKIFLVKSVICSSLSIIIENYVFYPKEFLYTTIFILLFENFSVMELFMTTGEMGVKARNKKQKKKTSWKKIYRKICLVHKPQSREKKERK